MIFGAMILATWILHWRGVQTIWPGLSRIPPNGGLLGFLLGAALAVKSNRPRPLFSLAGLAANLAALFAAALGLITFLEYLFGWNAGIDRLLPAAPIAPVPAVFPGRLSFPGALSALGLGLAILLLDVRIKGIWPAQIFAVLATIVALEAMIGHVCHAPEFYGNFGEKRPPGLPVHGVLGLLLLGAGVLNARPERGLVGILWSYTPGGILARWLLLSPVISLFLTGVVYLFFTHVIPVDRDIRTWCMGLANLLFPTLPIWGAAHALHKAGLERDRAQHELEDRVRQRTTELSDANLALHAEIRERQQVEQALREARDRLENQATLLERRVQERTAKLAETVGDLEAFSYSVAHDMRAPLRGMQGFAHLLLEEHATNLNPEARDYLDRISSSAARMDLLIRDALDYAQVLRSETDLKPVDLDGLARQFVATFPGWQPPHAEVTIAGPLPTVLGHEGFIVQCLSNLIGNAIKFVAPGTIPRVRIWAESTDGRVRVFIEDNGIGINARDHDRIFRMFERLNPAHEYDGTGIGLAVVRKAVERMKGQVDYESYPGRGTKFWIELPKAPLA